MNGQGFEMESRETKRIETKHRRIVTPIPVPESFDLIKEMQKYEPISNAGQPLIVWDHTEDGYKVCDPYGNKFIDFSSGVMITNAGHGNPEIIDAIKKTLDKPLLCAYLHPTKERVEAAKAICSVSPIPDSKAFMLSAGTAANIKFLKEHNMCEEALRKGKIMEEKLKALWKQFPERISYVSGIGMAWAVTFAEADTHAIHPEFALEVTKKCNENGLTFFAAVGAGITMKLTPPLTIPDDALIEGLEAYATAVAEADAIMPAYK